MMSDQSVSSLLIEKAQGRPDQPFLWCDGEWLSYAETVEKSDRLAAGLQSLGVEEGDRVAVILPNEQSAVLSVFACARLGAIQVPLNTFLRGEFLRHQLADCQAAVAITDVLGLQQIEDLRHELPDLRNIVLVTKSTEQDTLVSRVTVPITNYQKLMDRNYEGEFPKVDPKSKIG